jgi:hypothetical protein
VKAFTEHGRSRDRRFADRLGLDRSQLSGPPDVPYLRLGLSITFVVSSYSSCVCLSEILVGGKGGIGLSPPVGSLGSRMNAPKSANLSSFGALRCDRRPVLPDGHRFTATPDGVCEILCSSRDRRAPYSRCRLTHGLASPLPGWWICARATRRHMSSTRELGGRSAPLRGERVSVSLFDAVEIALRDLHGSAQWCPRSARTPPANTRGRSKSALWKAEHPDH